jgi:hypothetical protein
MHEVNHILCLHHIIGALMSKLQREQSHASCVVDINWHVDMVSANVWEHGKVTALVQKVASHLCKFEIWRIFSILSYIVISKTGDIGKPTFD